MKCPELQRDLWGTKYFCESGLKYNFIYVCSSLLQDKIERQKNTYVHING